MTRRAIVNRVRTLPLTSPGFSQSGSYTVIRLQQEAGGDEVRIRPAGQVPTGVEVRPPAFWSHRADVLSTVMNADAVHALEIAPASTHQQSSCSLAAGFAAAKLARATPALEYASCCPGRLFGRRADSPCCLRCYRG